MPASRIPGRIDVKLRDARVGIEGMHCSTIVSFRCFFQKIPAEFLQDRTLRIALPPGGTQWELLGRLVEKGDCGAKRKVDRLQSNRSTLAIGQLAPFRLALFPIFQSLLRIVEIRDGLVQFLLTDRFGRESLLRLNDKLFT